MVEFLKSGNYLSRISTTSVLAVFPTYNRDTQLYGHARMSAQWADSGRIEARFVLEALEFRDYSNAGLQAEGMRSRLATDMVLLVFILMYCMMTTRDVVKSFAAQQRRTRMLLELHNHMQEQMRARVDDTELLTFHTRMNPTFKPKKKRRASCEVAPPLQAHSHMLLGTNQSPSLLGSQSGQLPWGTRASAELPSVDACGGEEAGLPREKKQRQQSGVPHGQDQQQQGGGGMDACHATQGDGKHGGAASESKQWGHVMQVGPAKSAPSRWRVACELEPSDSEQPQQHVGCSGGSELGYHYHLQRHGSSASSAAPPPGFASVERSQYVESPHEPGNHSISSSTPLTSQGHQAPVLPHILTVNPPMIHAPGLHHFQPANQHQHHHHHPQQQQQEHLNQQQQQQQQRQQQRQQQQQEQQQQQRQSQQQQQQQRQQQHQQQQPGPTGSHPPSAFRRTPGALNPLSSREQDPPPPPSTLAHKHVPLPESSAVSSPAHSTGRMRQSPSLPTSVAAASADHLPPADRPLGSHYDNPPRVSSHTSTSRPIPHFLSAPMSAVQPPPLRHHAALEEGSLSHALPRGSRLSASVSASTAPLAAAPAAQQHNSSTTAPPPQRNSATTASAQPMRISPTFSASSPTARTHIQQGAPRVGSAQEGGKIPQPPAPRYWSVTEKGVGQHSWGAQGSQYHRGQVAAAESPAAPSPPTHGWGPVSEREGAPDTEARSGSWSSWKHHPHALAEEEPNDARVTYSRDSDVRGEVVSQTTIGRHHHHGMTGAE
ncbi:hypothetical protein DUNSADRAFT_11746, partial [Dunaliella salina]